MELDQNFVLIMEVLYTVSLLQSLLREALSLHKLVLYTA